MDKEHMDKRTEQPPERHGADSPPTPAIDPLDAVMAIAGNRPGGIGNEALLAPPNREEERPELVVETTVRMEGTASDGAAETGGNERSGDDATGEYDSLAWPDGFETDAQAMAKFAPLAKRLGLSKESAQELADLYVDIERRKTATQADFIARNNDEWLREIKSHPEFGGASLENTANDVTALLRRHGSPRLLAQIRQMNIQNWPEMFYFLARVASANAEDCSPASGNADPGGRSTAQLLFPGMR